jgi:uncharacterized damage-inducible protein DinB
VLDLWLDHDPQRCVLQVRELREYFRVCVICDRHEDHEDTKKMIPFIFKFPAFAYVQLGMHHSIHHRGQLSTVSATDGGEGSFDLR